MTAVKNFLFILIAAAFSSIQCSSSDDSAAGSKAADDSAKTAAAELPAVIKFECSYFNSPEPGSTAVLFAPDVFKDEDHQHSSPAFSPDGSEIYWSYNFSDKQTRRRKQIIVCSKFSNGVWSIPQTVSFSGNFYEGGPFITADNKRMYFYSKRPIEKGLGQKTDSDIWYSQRTETGWDEPVRLGFNTEFNETMPSVSSNGTVYFAAQYKGKEGPFHIYYSELKNGVHAKPKSMGPRINNDFRLSPYIAPDESFIIFASLNMPLHISYRKADGSWDRPVNLGSKIKTGKSQRFPMLSPDKKFLYFTSYKGGKEERYWMDAGFLFK